MYDITGMGEFLVDFACIKMNENGFPTMMGNPGGAIPNCMAAAQKRGARTAFIAKVGNDAFGKRLIETIEDADVDASGVIVTDEYFTTLAFVLIDENGDRSFSFSRKKSADIMIEYGEMDLGLVDNARALHVGSVSLTDEPSRTSVHKIVEYAKKKGKVITCDPNLREVLWKSLDDAKAEILWLLGQSDIIKISDNEVEFLWNISPEEGARKLLDEFGAKLVFVTCGAEGAVYANRNCIGRIKGPAVKPVDTTGAGDIFGGTAIAEIMKRANHEPGIEADRTGPNDKACILKMLDDLTDIELKMITRIACATASVSTENYGGISSVPDPADIEKRMN